MFARHFAVTRTPLTIVQRLIIETLLASPQWSVAAIVQTQRARGRTFVDDKAVYGALMQMYARDLVDFTERRFDHVEMFSLTAHGLGVACENGVAAA